MTANAERVLGWLTWVKTRTKIQGFGLHKSHKRGAPPPPAACNGGDRRLFRKEQQAFQLDLTPKPFLVHLYLLHTFASKRLVCTCFLVVFSWSSTCIWLIGVWLGEDLRTNTITTCVCVCRKVLDDVSIFQTIVLLWHSIVTTTERTYGFSKGINKHALLIHVI